jgi:TolB protein
MVKAIIIFFMFIISFSGRLALGASEVYINVTKPYFKKIVIAVPYSYRDGSFRKDDNLSREMALILANDLRISGLFEVIDNPLLVSAIAGSEGSVKVDFNQWRVLGAQALVKADYSLGEDKKLMIKCRLYDLLQEKQVLGKAYGGEQNLLRRMVHRLSDEIVLKLTGEKGMAQTRIAFISDVSGQKEVYSIDFDGHNLERLTRNRSIALSPAWSPDGKRIAYMSYHEGNPDLYFMSSDGSYQVAVSTFPGLNATPDWSPDGSRIALTLSKDGNAQIYTFKVDGTDFRRLTRDQSCDWSPSWSPDGERIAFGSDRTGTPEIYIMNKDGTDVRPLTHQGNYNDSPAWSPKGDLIAFASRQKGLFVFDIWVIGRDGNNPQRLTSNSGRNENPCWSPDGRYIVFSSTRKGNRDIYIMNSDGSNQRRLTFLGGNNYCPSWSPLESQETFGNNAQEGGGN